MIQSNDPKHKADRDEIDALLRDMRRNGVTPEKVERCKVILAAGNILDDTLKAYTTQLGVLTK